jgi:5-deoxy-D-glucuronate isomerase
MEEVYYFQFEPRQGFGFIRVYTDPSDEQPFDYAYAVKHGDTGYTLNYTWILAGEGRTYGAWADDPKHAWIRNV